MSEGPGEFCLVVAKASQVYVLVYTYKCLIAVYVYDCVVCVWQ